VGKWADAFKAHIRARDTADTGDTSLGGPEAFPGSVSSVMPTDERLGGRQAPYSGLVSSVSALSRPGRTRNAERRLCGLACCYVVPRSAPTPTKLG
jgi:hypothetical protein